MAQKRNQSIKQAHEKNYAGSPVTEKIQTKADNLRDAVSNLESIVSRLSSLACRIDGSDSGKPEPEKLRATSLHSVLSYCPDEIREQIDIMHSIIGNIEGMLF